jgi:hypothetical protein
MSANEAPQPGMSWVKSPSGIAEIYTNRIHATWSVDDVRMRLGQVVDSPQTPNPGTGFQGAIEERAAITFSWRNAKLLRDQLALMIESYEAVNGEINVNIELPPSI